MEIYKDPNFVRTLHSLLSPKTVNLDIITGPDNDFGVPLGGRDLCLSSFVYGEFFGQNPEVKPDDFFGPLFYTVPRSALKQVMDECAPDSIEYLAAKARLARLPP